jgi:hypothetical protein
MLWKETFSTSLLQQQDENQGNPFVARKVSRCRVLPSSAGNVFVPSVVAAVLRLLRS